MTIDERIEALVARHEALTIRHEALTERHEALTMSVEMMQIAQADIHQTHEEMQKEFRMVLTTQVLMSESLDKHNERIAAIEEQSAKFRQRTDQNLAEITDKLNGLIGHVAGHRPPEGVTPE